MVQKWPLYDMTIWPYYGQNMAPLWSLSFVLYVTFVCPAKLFRENNKANNWDKCPDLDFET